MRFMASGRDTQLTRQIGEHLVVAELGRRGFVATPFAGNVPNFDLLVANEAGDAIPVQVKTIRRESWQFKITSFLDIKIRKKRQIVTGRTLLPDPDLVCVFVLLGSGPGEDTFFTFTAKDLQNHFACVYKGRMYPKDLTCMHCAVWPDELQKFKGWKALHSSLGSTEGKLKHGVKSKSVLTLSLKKVS